MPRLLPRALLYSAIVLVACPPVWAQQTSLGPRLLPKTTKGALLVTDCEQLNKQWEQTQLGQLANDPVMEPFIKDLRRQFQDRFSRLRERLGLALDDLRGVPSGELDVAMIQPAKDRAVVAILVDVTGHLPQAKELLAKASANLIGQGAKKKEETIDGMTLMVLDVPETRDYPAGQVAYFLSEQDALLGAADDLEVMKEIIKRKVGQVAPGESLADVTAFGQVMARCQKHAGPAAPQIRWFVEPMGYVECLRTLTPDEKRRKGVTVLDVFRHQGFYAIQGIGGYINLKEGEFEVLHRTAVYAPGPYPKAPEPYKDKVAMDMLTFPNSRDYAVPSFIPNDVATCTIFSWDILKAFDNFGPTFDELFGEGEQGIWDDVLKSWKEDKYGPQIDVRNELIQYLDHQVTVVSDYVLPITTKSERLLFAVKIQPDRVKEVAAGIKKMLQDDPTIRRRECKELDGLEIWETVEQPQMQIPDAPVINLPDYTPGKKAETPKRERRFLRGEENEEELLLPHASVTVVHGHLLVASHYDFLIDVLTRAKTPDPLGDSADFKFVSSAMQTLGADEDCLRTFSRTDEEYRPTYELVRMGKMPEAETMFARMLNRLFGPQKAGVVRKPKIEGGQMPEFDAVRPYLGPAGTFGKTEADGWFVVGFMLKKPSTPSEQPAAAGKQ